MVTGEVITDSTIPFKDEVCILSWVLTSFFNEPSPNK